MITATTRKMIQATASPAPAAETIAASAAPAANGARKKLSVAISPTANTTAATSQISQGSILRRIIPCAAHAGDKPPRAWGARPILHRRWLRPAEEIPVPSFRLRRLLAPVLPLVILAALPAAAPARPLDVGIGENSPAM